MPRVQTAAEDVEIVSSSEESPTSNAPSSSSSPSSPAADQSAAAASSSSAAPAPRPTRAPGTPVRPMLDRIPRLTPAELLPEVGRVNTQVQEVDRLREAFDQMREAHQEEGEFSSQGWSGNFFNYSLGDEELHMKPDGSWSLMAKRNDEISLKDLSQDELKLFEASDQLEWQAILKTGAVRVVHGAEATKLREQFPDRIISYTHGPPKEATTRAPQMEGKIALVHSRSP
eukprot:s4658_g5.t1